MCTKVTTHPGFSVMTHCQTNSGKKDRTRKQGIFVFSLHVDCLQFTSRTARNQCFLTTPRKRSTKTTSTRLTRGRKYRPNCEVMRSSQHKSQEQREDQGKCSQDCLPSNKKVHTHTHTHTSTSPNHKQTHTEVKLTKLNPHILQSLGKSQVLDLHRGQLNPW